MIVSTATRLRLLVVLAAILAGPASAQDAKRVLMLHSFGTNFTPFSSFGREMRAELVQRAPGPLDMHEVPFEAVRFLDPALAEPFVAYLQALYQEHPPDLVVTFGQPAAELARRYRAQLFPGTPLLNAALEQRRLPAPSLTRQEVTMAIGLDLTGSIATARHLLPETREVFVVLGNTALERAWADDAAAEFARTLPDLTFFFSNDLHYEELLDRAASLPSDAVVLYGMLLVDAGGVPHEADEALAELSATSAVPVFGLFDSQLGEGIVGGPLIPVGELARDAAGVAIRLLQGEPASSFDIPPARPGAPRFDARQLERWRIAEDALPPGSIVEFREPTAWSRYRWQIVTALSALLIEGALIIALMLSRRRLSRSRDMLRESEGRLSLAADAATLGLWGLDLRAREMWLSDPCRHLLNLHGRVTLDDFIAAADPSDQPGLRAAIERAETDAAGFEAEYRLRGDVGATRWVASRGRVERDASGEPRRLRGVTLDITERRAAEQEARALGGRLIRAQEDERARLARELHDDLTQRLAMLAIEAGQGERKTTDLPTGATLGRIRQGLARLSEDVHALSYRLHPSLLRDLGLEEALRVECEAFSRAHSIPVSLVSRDVPEDLQDDTALCLYRIMQEALRNAARHAGAERIEVRTWAADGAVHLTVADDGKGFSHNRRRSSTLGLASMRQRAEHAGGELRIESAAAKGTIVAVSIPLGEEHDDEAARAAG